MDQNEVLDFNFGDFRVYKSTDGGASYEPIGRIENEINVYNYFFDDTYVEPGETCYYFVVAYYSVEEYDAATGPVSCLVTSVGESIAKPELFPNPTAGKVTVKAEGMERIVVVNSLGQTLYQANTEAPEMALDLAPFGKGMYFIMIQTSQGVTTQRIVVE